jgi:hypothetical protein
MKKRLLSLHVIILFIGMIFLYENVSYIFGYWGFTFNLNIIRCFFSIIALLLFTNLFLQKKIFDFSRVFLIYWLFFIFIPISVLFSVSLINFYLYFCHISFIFLIGFFITFRRKIIFTKKIFKPKSFEKNKYFWFFLSLILSIPLVEILINFNLASFNLFDVYGIRLEARESGNRLIGYLKESLSRVVYPFFLIYGYIHKKWFLFFFGLLSIILVFGSTGALKSIIAIIPISFLFIKSRNYITVQNTLLLLLYFIVFFPLIETLFFETYFLTDLPSRRLLFVPGLFENAYITEYINNSQFYLNSLLKSFNQNPESLTMHIGGKYFDKPEMNANVGLVIDGFINLGYFGVILHAILVYIIIAIINGYKMSPKYFGIFFVYFYYMNTSFIGSLLLTHGLFFLLIFFYFLKTNHESSSYMSKL